ncbi:aldehyde dehydrogenase family protein [Streptomyces sp. NBC_01803]|uniref:aldehyde dehydrogenase family protein n=1 Tax=Streptomyces sp. NBC_01803 TaxID=2975946 RepID=UPI002DD937F1|nr:aldehyde dehydrogenase family protein [Streptomyces sp. NBC_01803]WSA43363.1 aldehyde dehydrogenase family protein [Streptomyces sp. NBC_01803]
MEPAKVAVAVPLSSSPLAVTAPWQPPAGALWGGVWRDGETSFTVHDPEDGSRLGSVTDASAAEVGAAVEAVAAAVHSGQPWPAWRRREALQRAAALLGQRRVTLAELISREGSKTVREADAEVSRAAETLRLSAEQAGRLTGETLPFDDTARGAGRLGWYTREPVGVVAAITPFNDPLNLVAHKLGPALVAGNGVVLKPAEATPLTALAFAAVLLDAGIPADRLAVVPGTGARAGQALVGHPLVDLVSFTGGHRTGDAVARAAGAKKTLMELGGNNCVLVLHDADPVRAARAVVAGAFGVAGQNCLSVQRVLVAAPLVDRFTDEVVAATGLLRVGSKRDPRTDVGPLITEREAARVALWVEEALTDGAVLRAGGRREGAFHWPTVLTGVPAAARLMVEEVFGPVLAIDAFDTVDEAVARANGTAFGLQAGVFTAGLDTALAVAERLRVGAVMINDSSDFRIDAMPFGGPKRSGVGREGVRYAVEAMTEPKIVAVRRD